MILLLLQIIKEEQEVEPFVGFGGPHLHTFIYTGEGEHIRITSHFIAPTHTSRGNFKLVWFTACTCVSVALYCTERSEPLTHSGMCSDFTGSTQIWVDKDNKASTSQNKLDFCSVCKKNAVLNHFEFIHQKVIRR